MSEWVEKELGEILTLNYGWSLPEKKRVVGDIPVYGSNGIVGCHNQALVQSAGLIVGRKGSAGNVHFSRKPFCPIDTTFFVGPGDTPLNLAFLYYLLLHLNLKRILGDVGVPGLNREVAYKEKAWFPSAKDEQRKIAEVLGLVQRAIEQQEQLLALAAELKRALLHKLFTTGLRGEPQKQTEIGPVPESWEEKLATDVFARVTDGTHDTPNKQDAGYPLVTSKALKDGKVLLSQASYMISRDDFMEISRRSGVGVDDILFSMIGTVGEVALVEEEPSYAIKNVGLFKVKEKMASRYCFHYFQSPQAKTYIRNNLSGTSQKYLPLIKLRHFPVLLPTRGEMLELTTILDEVDRKIELAQKQRALRADLFRTLLRQLMTAQIRVHDLDLSELEVAINP